MSTENTATAEQPAANTTPVLGVIDATNGFGLDTSGQASAATDDAAGTNTDPAAAGDGADGTEESQNDADIELGGIYERVDGVDKLSAAGIETLKELAADPALAEASLIALATRFGEELSTARKHSRTWEKRAKAAGKGASETDPEAAAAAAAAAAEAASELATVRRELSQTRAAAMTGLPLELADSLRGETAEEILAAAVAVSEKLAALYGPSTSSTPPKKRATLDSSNRSDGPTVTGVDRLFA